MLIETIIKKRQALARELLEFPSTEDNTSAILDYKILILDLQIECERRRQDIRMTAAMSRKRTITKVDGNLEIQKVVSFFGWEKLDKSILDAINEKETKGIEYFTDQINTIRNGNTGTKSN